MISVKMPTRPRQVHLNNNYMSETSLKAIELEWPAEEQITLPRPNSPHQSNQAAPNVTESE